MKYSNVLQIFITCVYISTISTLIFITFGCTNISDNLDNKNNQEWRVQLNKLKSPNNLYLAKTNLKLLNYRKLKTIKTLGEIEEIQKEILSDESYVPNYVPGKISTLSLKTYADIKSGAYKQNSNFSYDLNSIGTHLDTLLKIGQSLMEIQQ